MLRSQTSRGRARLLPLCLFLAAAGLTLSALSVAARRASARSATTFFVTNVEDLGPGSLRQAIIDANNSPGTDTIAFNIPGNVRTIKPVLNLPTITDTVVIDGTTQPGFAGTPVVELNGANAVSGGIGIGAPGTVIRGLVINGFSGGIGIGSAGGGSHIEGCYIGTDVTGTVAVGNSGNGISIGSSNNVIGGTTPDKRNVISGNSAGIQIEVFCCTGTVPAANGNLIQGNYIGLNAAGNAALPNREEGVRITTSSGEGGVSANVVGGSEPGAGNVISGNRSDGVFLGSFQTTGNIVKGNIIGADATGTFPLPNSGDGIRIDLGRDNVIGGSEAGARNVVSGNGVNASGTGRGNGITVGGSGNVVRGNFVGLNAAGDAPMPNLLHGVAVGGSNQTIGGTGAGEGNTIAFSGFDGIVCGNPASANNSFRGNSIFSNGIFNGDPSFPTLGIDLGGANVTPNDSGDGDTGANGLQNFPVITSATAVAGGINVKGTLNSTAGTTFALDFYANSVCDASGNGEGARRLGSTNVTTNAGGDASFDVTFPASKTANQVVTATATDPSGNTSEFSQCAQTSPPVGSVSFASPSATVSEAVGTTSFTVTRAGGTAGTLSVNFSVIGVTAAAGMDFTATQGTLTFADGETSKSFDVPILNDNLDELFSETAKVTLSTSDDLDTLGVVSVVTLTINDDDPAPGVSVGDVSASEGDAGSKDFNFPVTLSAVSARAVTVTYATSDGTASAGSDYTAVESGTLVIPAGQTSGTITVKVTGDAAVEPDETFTLSFTNVTAATVVDGDATGTIQNDDSASKVTVSVGNALVTEGGPGTTANAVFTATLSAASSQTVTVDAATAAGTADENLDFVPVSTQLSFAPGETTKTVTVQVKGDNIWEGNETFSLGLSNPSNATVAGNPGTGTIVDDETRPTLSVGDVTVTEGDSGTKDASFTVTLSGPSSLPAGFEFKTSNATAVDGEDYIGVSGFTTIAPGETTKTVTVQVLGDTVTESDETFTLNIQNPTDTSVADGQGIGLIKDNESASGPTTLQFFARQSVTSETIGSVNITVTRSGDASTPVTVDYATRSNTGAGQASDRTDYTPVFGTLRFEAGVTAKFFTVPVNDDSFQEGDEFFEVFLSNPTGGASLGQPNTAVVTIKDHLLFPPFQNPIDVSSSFVRQHYHDFLSREPDNAGLAFWTNEIEKCGADAQCRDVRRVNVSAAFFLSIEFQQSGYLVYKTYKTAFGDATSPGVPGTVPVVRFEEFLPDTQRIGQNVIVGEGAWEAQLEANKVAFFQNFVTRPRFASGAPTSMTPAQFVDALFANAGVTPTAAERQAAINEFGGAANMADTAARARALRRVAEHPQLHQKELNRAFVLMEYFGYLRRNPSDAPEPTLNYAGWKFWLDKLNQFNGNFVQAEMVKAFISSDEYRHRFGQ